MFTAREKYEDALREVKLRERVFARMVNVGKLSKELAERRIAIMSEIAFEYKELMKREDLFGEDPVSPSRAKADWYDPRAAARARQDRTSRPRQETAAENRGGADTAQANQGRTSSSDTGPPSNLPSDSTRADGEKPTQTDQNGSRT